VSALAGLCVGLVVAGPREDAVKWEYLAVNGEEYGRLVDISDRLADLGAEGWELVSAGWLIEGGQALVVGAILKRPARLRLP